MLVLSYLVGLNIHLSGVLCFWRKHDFSLTQNVHVIWLFLYICWHSMFVMLHLWPGSLHIICVFVSLIIRHFSEECLFTSAPFPYVVVFFVCQVTCLQFWTPVFFNQHKFVLNSGKQFFELNSMELVWILESIFEPDSIKLFWILEAGFELVNIVFWDTDSWVLNWCVSLRIITLW